MEKVLSHAIWCSALQESTVRRQFFGLLLHRQCRPDDVSFFSASHNTFFPIFSLCFFTALLFADGYTGPDQSHDDCALAIHVY